MDEKTKRGVEAAIEEINRQYQAEGQGGAYAYGDPAFPSSYGVDGELDLVALVEAITAAVDGR